MKIPFLNKLLLPVLILIPLFTLSQENKISAKLIDEKGKPVAYASIVFIVANRNLSSDIDGNFSFSYSERDINDTLWISNIGYEKKKVPVKEVISKPLITLFSKNYELPIIPVSARQAENLVKKAIEKIPDNYPQTPYTMEFFFRQFHRENGNAARLIEAVLNVYDPGYTSPKSLSMKELFEVKALRRSKVFERNGATHSDHLFDLFMQNIVHYPRETLLHAPAIDFFHFERNDSLSTEPLTCINFYYKNPSDPKIRWGELYINTTDYAIVKMDENTTKNNNYNPPALTGSPTEWKFTEGETTITYKRVAGKYYLDSISFFYRHNIVNKAFGTLDFTVDEYFNFWTGMPDTVNIPVDHPGKSFQKTTDLYLKKYEYDVKFWDIYLPAIAHPLSPDIIAEFEKQTPLQQQFIRYGSPWH